MITIWKYPLLITDVQEIGLPKNAGILTVQMQGAKLCLWALVDPKEELVPTKLRIYGTGNPVDASVDDHMYHIGTVQDGGMVWHVFHEFR